MGLVEQEWIDTLATVDPEDIIFLDFVETGNKLAAELREEVCTNKLFLFLSNILMIFNVYTCMMIRDKPNVHMGQSGYNLYLTNITALNMLAADI